MHWQKHCHNTKVFHIAFIGNCIGQRCVMQGKCNGKLAVVLILKIFSSKVRLLILYILARECLPQSSL